MAEELDEWNQSARALADEMTKAPEYRDGETINRNLELSLDAIVDLMYVVLGTAYMQGFFPVLEEAWKRVQKANMSKIKKLKGDGTEQESGRNPIYDVVKPANFVPPSHLDLVTNNAHTSMMQEPES
jgi:predicted HAD superfamily Cof-like phosphohydrolase